MPLSTCAASVENAPSGSQSKPAAAAKRTAPHLSSTLRNSHRWRNSRDDATGNTSCLTCSMHWRMLLRQCRLTYIPPAVRLFSPLRAAFHSSRRAHSTVHASPPQPLPSAATRTMMWGAGLSIMPDFSAGSWQQQHDSLSPELFPSPSSSSALLDLSIGDHHVALLTADGCVYTCGEGQYGELGWEQHNTAATTLNRVEGLPPCVSVRCGEYHTVALSRRGQVWVWGWGGSLWSIWRAGSGSTAWHHSHPAAARCATTDSGTANSGRWDAQPRSHTGRCGVCMR